MERKFHRGATPMYGLNLASVLLDTNPTPTAVVEDGAAEEATITEVIAVLPTTPITLLSSTVNKEDMLATINKHQPLRWEEKERRDKKITRQNGLPITLHKLLLDTLIPMSPQQEQQKREQKEQSTTQKSGKSIIECKLQLPLKIPMLLLLTVFNLRSNHLKPGADLLPSDFMLTHIAMYSTVLYIYLVPNQRVLQQSAPAGCRAQRSTQCTTC